MFNKDILQRGYCNWGIKKTTLTQSEAFLIFSICINHIKSKRLTVQKEERWTQISKLARYGRITFKRGHSYNRDEV